MEEIDKKERILKKIPISDPFNKRIHISILHQTTIILGF